MKTNSWKHIYILYVMYYISYIYSYLFSYMNLSLQSFIVDYVAHLPTPTISRCIRITKSWARRSSANADDFVIHPHHEIVGASFIGQHR